MEVSIDNKPAMAWTRVPLAETPAHFKSFDAQLDGLLIEPQDGQTKHPLVILLHGSESTAALQFGRNYAYIFAAQGIAVFMYDKRGTGTSEGFYTQDFELLADDAVAASEEARRMLAGRYSRWGYFGGSQGGWIGPRAAEKSNPDFVEVGFGLVETPLEEDQQQVQLELRNKGYGPDVLAKALQVTNATAVVVASHFTSGYDQLKQIKERYGKEPWFSQIKGEFTGTVLHDDPAELRVTGEARVNPVGVLWHYDAQRVVRSLKMPQLWVLAGADREAPSDLARERLTDLIHQGHNIDLYVYPHTDHGIADYVELPNGDRKVTRIADGYLRLLGDWAKEKLNPPYGRAEKVGGNGTAKPVQRAH
ncbi:MAG: alpha/beta hydrolase [Sphingomonas sp.]